MKFNKIFVVLAILLLVIILFLLSDCSPKQKVVTVDCDNGGSLSKEVSEADDGTRIEVVSNCTESNPVVITKDIVINGNDKVINGTGADSVFTINGANVIINDLTVEEGGRGIVAFNGSKVILRNVSVTGVSGSGITVSGTSEMPMPLRDGEEPDQVESEEQGSPQLMKRFDISLISNAVAVQDSCDCYSSECVSEIDRGDTTVLCEDVSSNNNQDGVYVASNATLEVKGSLSLLNNTYNGMYVRRSTVIIDDNGKLITGMNGYYDLEINGNSSVTCKDDPLTERLISNGTIQLC